MLIVIILGYNFIHKITVILRVTYVQYVNYVRYY